MSNAPGWYPQPDGQQRYWDGMQWTHHVAPGAVFPPAENRPAEVTRVRKRRNHAVAGLGFVLGAALIALAVTQPLETYSGPPISLNLLKEVNLTVTPSSGYGLDASTLSLLLGVAVALAVFGLLLLVTRIRFLGLVWRLGGLLVLAVPAVLVVSHWMFIADPTASLKRNADTDVLSQGAALLADKTRGIAWDVAPAIGLYILTAGVICTVLSALVPAIRRQEVLHEGVPR